MTDLAPGQRFEATVETLAEASIIEYATAYDYQRMHIDPTAGPVIASGWQTAAIALRTMRAIAFPGDADGAVIDRLAWREPVRPGDTLHITVELLALDDDRLAWRTTASNQHGNPVLTLEGSTPRASL